MRYTKRASTPSPTTDLMTTHTVWRRVLITMPLMMRLLKTMIMILVTRLIMIMPMQAVKVLLTQ